MRYGGQGRGIEKHFPSGRIQAENLWKRWWKNVLTVENLCVSLGGRPVLRNLSFSLEAGQWLMVVGPNGAGKTTLVNALTGGVERTGAVRFQGREVSTMRARELARAMGVLVQRHAVDYAFTVREVVEMGRYAHRMLRAGRTDADERCVEAALRDTGMAALADQSMMKLSGGEVQRAFLAQVFAQQPQILLLDEPANHLDPAYQKQIFDLTRAWLKTPGRAVLSVVHDLSLARSYGTRALLLGADGPVAQGEIARTLSRENLRRAYGMDVRGWLDDLAGAWNA